jgi:hypothetical protein
MAVPRPKRTPDAVVGANIRRLRGLKTPRWTQRALAERLSEITGERGWKDRIVRMEGTELETYPDGSPMLSDRQTYRSAKWPELISLALALKTSLYELVLPDDDETQVVVASASRSEETPAVLPDGTSFPKRSSTSYIHPSDRNELANLLFGVSGNYVTVESLAKLSPYQGSDTAEAVADIQNVQGGLEQMFERMSVQLEELRKRQEISDGE